MNITEAQAKRTRLQVWKDVLTMWGGTPVRTDTLHRTYEKIAVAAGVSLTCCNEVTLRQLLYRTVLAQGDASGWNGTIYQLARKLGVVMGAELDCCDLPPPQGLFGDTYSLSDFADLCVDVEASVTITASFTGTMPVLWTISGSLPAGLTFHGGSLNSTSVVIDGTPTEAGDFTFTITAVDAAGLTATRTYTLTILTLTDESILPEAQEGDAYLYTFTPSGGIGPFVFRFIGNLPPGLTFNENTGVLSGTPTTAGTYNFTVAVEVGTGDDPVTPTPDPSASLLVDYEGNYIDDQYQNTVSVP